MLQNYLVSYPTVNNAFHFEAYSSSVPSFQPKKPPEPIDLFQPTDNSAQYRSPNELFKKLHGKRYLTVPDDEYRDFLPSDPNEIRELIRQQELTYSDVRLELQYSQSILSATDEQYSELLFHGPYAYPTDALLKYAADIELQDSRALFAHPYETLPQPTTNPSTAPTVSIDVNAIRQITGYDPVPWQRQLLQDQSRFIFLVGSRQIGKSFTLAELAIERSFIPRHRIMVASFVLNSTRAIRDYILDLTTAFGDTFSYYKREDYVINNHSGAKIYFRTLSDEGRTVRGLKLDIAIIDEAAYVPNEIYEKVIMPTVATTDGQIVAISSPDGRNWFYEKVTDAKRGAPNHAVYEIDVTKNPFISDTLRQYVMENRHKRNIRQEYFCEFGSTQDSLYEPTYADFFPPISSSSPNQYLVVGYDPARKKDRSGLTFLLVRPNAQTPVTVIASEAIPDSHKSSYALQARYVRSRIDEFKFPQSNTFLAMDVTGVGDVVYSELKKLVPITYSILYTSGNNTESEPDRRTYPGSTHYRTSKSLLISNLLDFHDESSIEIYEYSNQALLEEISYLTRTTGKLGQLGFTSNFFDDVFNSLLLATYAVKKRGLLTKQTKQSQQETEHVPFSEYDYQPVNKNRNGNVF